MILTVDLNPMLDKTIDLDRIHIGEYNQGKVSSYGPGGHGIMATSLLHAFNEEVFMTGFLGGINGEYFHKVLSDSNLPHEFTLIKEETTTRLKIYDKDERYTTIVEESPRITREEVGRFYSLYAKLIEESNIISCVGGQAPIGLPEDMYFNLIKLARERRRRIILDIRSNLSKLTLDAIPYMVIMDQNQLEDIIGLKLNFKNEIIKAASFILDKGVKYVLINLNSEGSVFLGQDKGYIIDSAKEEEKWNTKNSSMAAGFAMGFNREYDMDMILRLGQASGIVSCQENNRKIELADIKRLMGQMEIYPINY